MKTKLLATVTILFVLSGVVVSSQNYNDYRFQGVPKCNKLQILRFQDFLLEVVATDAIGDTPEDFAESVKEQAKAQFQEQLESQSTRQLEELHFKIMEAITRGEFDQYDALMQSYWDSPIMCRQALETIQRVNEFERTRLLGYTVLLLDETGDVSEALAQKVAYDITGNAIPRLEELIEFFVQNGR